eukprot:CAMPEP_0204003690 /NCGR_PEP_ID=MMETSP0360-20130528/17854_1 /ASSEMBLY_ACC=CAM_ASM_000342 /TAXON_ID=268821 /ORGANISM="Scrippsiella Hangoei, Strain SHTV-5" /LENGTH=37 /DNA_ID= /DNA_START= /DNA_END= /DNA_ORIENTATION=
MTTPSKKNAEYRPNAQVILGIASAKIALHVSKVAMPS